MGYKSRRVSKDTFPLRRITNGIKFEPCNRSSFATKLLRFSFLALLQGKFCGALSCMLACYILNNENVIHKKKKDVILNVKLTVLTILYSSFLDSLEVVLWGVGQGAPSGGLHCRGLRVSVIVNYDVQICTNLQCHHHVLTCSPGFR